MKKTYPDSLYHLIAIITIIIWGTTFVSTKILINKGVSAVEIFLFRFLIAYIFIWFISPKKLWAENKKDELLFMLGGLSGGSLYFVAENTALEITLASNVALLVCTAPLFTLFLNSALNKKISLGISELIGAFIALAGVALVVFNGSFILKLSPLGDLLTLIAALSWAFYCLILKHLTSKYSINFITRKIFFYGLITLIPILIIKPISVSISIIQQPVVYINLLFLGLLASLLCFIMWNTTVKQLGAAKTANYIYLVPIITIITSAIVLKEPVTPIATVGSILILGGIYISEKKQYFIKIKKTNT